jgi:hypothetical protein
MELPEMDIFYLEEIEQLRTGLANLETAKGKDAEKLTEAWQSLKTAAKAWGWSISDLKVASETSGAGDLDETDEDEEGEYAPQVVET